MKRAKRSKRRLKRSPGFQPKVKKSANSNTIGRLFIDPASISSGWAYFRGKELVSHGTVAVDKKMPIFNRLCVIYAVYKHLVVDGSVDEVHLEQLPRTCHIYTHWSVGCIGAALWRPSVTVAGDIPVKSWQKCVEWDADDEGSNAIWGVLKHTPSSGDEAAAVGMGLYYLEKVVGSQTGGLG